MPLKAIKEVVEDIIDPNSILRPNLPLKPAYSNYFKPLDCPPFNYQKYIPFNIIKPFNFFSLYLIK